MPHGEEIIEIDTDGNVSKPRIAGIAAVLAAEDVVDPEIHKRVCDVCVSHGQNLNELTKTAEEQHQQLAALREEIVDLKDRVYTPLTGRPRDVVLMRAEIRLLKQQLATAIRDKIPQESDSNQ